MQLRANGAETGIPDMYKQLLICKYGSDLVNRVTVYWDVKPTDHFSAFGKVYASGSGAQTFCTDVYVKAPKSADYDVYMQNLLMHEFMHVQQCQRQNWDTTTTFVDYMTKFCDADYSYRDNVNEVEVSILSDVAFSVYICWCVFMGYLGFLV